MTPEAQHTPTGGWTSVVPPPSGPWPGDRRGWWRRRRIAVLAAVVVAAVAGGAYLVLADRPVRVEQTPDPRTSPPADWLSGAATEDVVTIDQMGEWRGRSMEIAGTWSDNNEAMVELWQLHDEEQFGSWDRPLDIAIGAIDDDQEGESWEEATEGAYDDRWRESLANLRELREGKDTTYIRFAHEMNGDWFDWSVDADDHEAFVEAWQRFRALQQDVFPEAQLVFNVNRESVGTDMDWREFFPGAEYVDVMAVDYYNRYPYVETAEEWADSLDDTDEYGAPKGLQQHLDFARSVGLPLAVPEWSGSAEDGDSPAFIRGMYEFFSENAGTGAGQLLYEIHFNVDKDDLNWLLFGENLRMPESARTYQELW